jgi:hypothetical protein
LGFGSGRVSGHLVSGDFGFWVVSGRVSGHLVLGHFGIRVVSSRVGSGIRSFNVGLFRVMSHIASERVRRVSRVGSGSATSIPPDQTVEHDFHIEISLEINFF